MAIKKPVRPTPKPNTKAVSLMDNQDTQNKGDSVPKQVKQTKTNKIRVNFLLDKDTYETLRNYSFNNHISISEIIRKSIKTVIN